MNTSDTTYNTNPEPGDKDYDAYMDSLLGLAEAIDNVPSKPSKKDAVAHPVDKGALLGAFQLIDRALNADGLSDNDLEGLLHKAEKRLVKARPVRTDKFENVSLVSLMGAAMAPVPMLETAFTLPSGKSIIPAGELSWVSAPPSSGKSFIATSQVLNSAQVGGRPVFIDFESTPTVFVRRLLQLGADAADLEQITYLAPRVGWAAADLQQIIAQAVTQVVNASSDLLVLDGFAQAATRLGFEENDNADMALFSAALTEIAYSTGAAVIVIDHIGKGAADSNSRYARGASAKLGQPAFAVRVDVVNSPSQGRPGRVNLVVAKDRHGVVAPEGDIAAVVEFVPVERDGIDGGVFLKLSAGGVTEGGFPDKTLMMLARRLHEMGTATKTEIRNLTYDRGEKEGTKCFSRKRFTEEVEPMLEWLVTDGHLGVETIKGGSKYHWVGEKFTTADCDRIRIRLSTDEEKGEQL